MISEQFFSVLQLPPKTLGGCWWYKGQHKQSNVHVEGRDEKREIVYNRGEALRERDQKIEKETL